MRPTEIRINLAAIERNIKKAAKIVDQPVMLVVKANAYAFGIKKVVERCHSLPECDSFAVAFGEEAFELRDILNDLANDKDILTMEGFFSEQDLLAHLEHKIIPAIHHPAQLEILKKAKPKIEAQLEHKLEHKRKNQGFQPMRLWLKHNSNMNRLGLDAKQLYEAAKWLGEQDIFKLECIMTHFATANRPDQTFAIGQVAAFVKALSELEDLIDRDNPPKLSLSNSAGLVSLSGEKQIHQHLYERLDKNSWLRRAQHICRPGIMIYGASPLDEIKNEEIGLETALSLNTQLISVRPLKKGDKVGYENSWIAKKDGMMGIAPIGYADGYPFVEPSRIEQLPLLVNGKRCFLGGRVSMDMLCIDLTNCPDAKVGDEIELWGANITINEIADVVICPVQRLFSAITPRVRRVYL